MLWGLLFLILFALVCTGLIYLGGKIKGISFIKKLTEKNKAACILIPTVIIAVITSICVTAFKMFAAIVVLLHFILFWLICDLLGAITNKFLKKKLTADIKAIIAVSATCVYLGIGWYFAHHIYETSYTIETEKLTQPLRIVQLADSHLGVTLDGEEFASELEEIEKLSPDALVITGDFVDDDSSLDDIKVACEALGKLKTTYGVYYTYGNHDKGYSDFKDYTARLLLDELEKNGVTVMSDEYVLINDSFYIIGRNDTSVHERKTIPELCENLDKDKYMIVLDHQPNDYDSQEKAGVDLVLSGHTHGGHVFPAGFIGLLIGANDKVYGHEKRGNTDFIVTSGISGWAIPFKTGCISEYVVIDIK